MIASFSLSDEDEAVKIYSETDLIGMTVASIKAIAIERGYTITKTVKADIIAEFIEQQGA